MQLTLDISFFYDIIAFVELINLNKNEYPGVAQLVARLTGGQEAGSSSLLTQTNKADNSFELPALFFYFHNKRRLELLSPKAIIPVSLQANREGDRP